MTFHQVDGISLWVEEAGTGPRVLFISGTGGDLRRKPNVLDGPLAMSFTVAAFDQRGLGQSDKPDGPYSMAGYARDAVGVLDALGWDRAHVMGVSFGGMVAQELAVTCPERLEKLVLCCTSPGGAGGSSYPLHELAGLAPEVRARKMIGVSNTTRDAAWAQANPERFEKLVEMALDDPYAGEPRRALGAQLQLEARSHHDVWDRLPTVRAKTLICAGRYDGLARPETQERMAAQIPDAQLAWFEGGHLFLLEDRSANPAIEAFLKA
jgi:3-oxoadipate enol-lactonase